MKLYLLAATISLALAAQAQIHAHAPDVDVHVVTPASPEYQELYLSTSLDTCTPLREALVPFEAVADLPALPPRRYDYRQARQTGRRYARVVRYYKRKNRRDYRDIRKNKRQELRRNKLPAASGVP